MSLQEADAPLLPSTPRHLADARPAPRFRTPCRRRGMLALVFCLSCLAGGPVTSWPTFEPMLGELGVRTVGELAAMPRERLMQRFGEKTGAWVIVDKEKMWGAVADMKKTPKMFTCSCHMWY